MGVHTKFTTLHIHETNNANSGVMGKEGGGSRLHRSKHGITDRIDCIPHVGYPCFLCKL